MKTFITFVTEIQSVIEDGSGFIFLSTASREQFLTYVNGLFEKTTLDELILSIDNMFSLSAKDQQLIKNEVTERYEEYFLGTEYHQILVDAGLADPIEEEIEELPPPPKSSPVKEKSFLQGIFKKSSNIYIAVAGILIFAIIIAAASSSSE